MGKGGDGMRRVVLLLATLVAALLLANGVALAVARSGGPGDDTLRGTNGTDVMEGNGGNDDLLGLRGTDALDGGGGRDAVLGGNEAGPRAGDRVLSGGPGRDFVGGGKGSDALSGGPDSDGMFAGPRFGEADDDAIEAGNVPAAKDIIDCGEGFDRVLMDGKDFTSDCERKFISPRKYFNSIRGEGYFAPLPSL